MMESPAEAREIALPIVLQAVVGDLQSLLSLPPTRLTYHVLAEAAELIRHKTVSSNAVVRPVCFTIVSFSSCQPPASLDLRDVGPQETWLRPQLQFTNPIAC